MELRINKDYPNFQLGTWQRVDVQLLNGSERFLRYCDTATFWVEWFLVSHFLMEYCYLHLFVCVGFWLVFFGRAMRHVGSQLPDQGSNLYPPLHWELGAWSLNHWTTREVLLPPSLKRKSRFLFNIWFILATTPKLEIETKSPKKKVLPNKQQRQILKTSIVGLGSFT